MQDAPSRHWYSISCKCGRCVSYTGGCGIVFQSQTKTIRSSLSLRHHSCKTSIMRTHWFVDGKRRHDADGWTKFALLLKVYCTLFRPHKFMLSFGSHPRKLSLWSRDVPSTTVSIAAHPTSPVFIPHNVLRPRSQLEMDVRLHQCTMGFSGSARVLCRSI